MERVDLTGIWRDGEFYKMRAIHNCRGCEFWADPEIKGNINCYDALGCEPDKEFVYIKTDDISVANFMQRRLDAAAEDKQTN